MPPDEDGGGRGQGLAMLRLEARRYKREMQQIWMQRQLHEQKRSTSSFSSEDSSRAQDGKWRFSDTFTTSPATSGTPMFWNRKDVPVSRLEQLVIAEKRTQTDTPSKSEVQTETEKLQIDDDVISVTNESKAVSSATNIASVLKTCSRHCDELRSKISQEAACECLADAAVRVNADVVFTAKPNRVAGEGQMETSDCSHFRAFRPAETGVVSHTSTMAASPTVGLDKGQKSTDPVQDGRIDLRSLVAPVPQRDSACSPIHNLHGYGARYTSLGDTSKGKISTEIFSWQHDRPAHGRSSEIAPAPFSSTPASTPRPEVSCGGTKAGDNTSDFSTEISGSKRIRYESTGEGAMAARLASKIKHALEVISEKGDTRSISSTFILPGRAIQSTSACRLHYKDQTPAAKVFEDASGSSEGRTLNDKETASNDSSLPDTCQHPRKAPVSSSQHHTISTPCSDADIYSENVMAAFCTNRYTPKKLSGSCIAGQVSPARSIKSADRRAEAARRVNVKSCGDHHASHGVDGIENSVKTDVRQSGSKHAMEKQRLLSNVQKLQNVAETAKRLYTDLVDCANDELRTSADCRNLVNHQDGESAGDVFKFSRSEFCPSTEIISAHRAAVASKDEVCGRCHVCQPQCDDEQPPEEAQPDFLDEITIQLSDASPTNIMVSRNDCAERPGFNVEVSTPCELPCQRDCSPNSRGRNIVRRGRASWKDVREPASPRMRPAGPGRNQPVKKGSNKCLVDPCCDGPRDSCHMPTRRKSSSLASTVRFSPPKKCSTKRLLDPHCNGPRNSCHVSTRAKCSGATTICISPPKRDSNKCLLDPRCDGPRNSCHMPTRAKCSGAATVSTVCISPPKKDSNLCCLDPRCAGSRDSCHMPTYAKSTRASCGPGGSSRSNRNNGTELGNKDPPGLPGCLVHLRRGMEPVKGKLESNPYCGRFRSAGKVHTSSLRDEKPGHIFLHDRIHNSPARRSRDLSKFPKGCLDDVSNVDHLSEARGNRNLCMMHDVSSSMKGKETEIANGGHEETAGLQYFLNERKDVYNPVKNVHRSLQECSRIGVVNNHSMLTATEDFEERHSSVGKETRQPAVRHVIGNASTLSEAYTQTTQPQKPEADYVDRAVAAAELAKDIEVMIADQLGKSNRRIRESKYSMSRRKRFEDQKDSFGQTKLDVGVIAAANAVKKLKPVSFLPLVKQDEGNQKATPRKGPTTRGKLMAEDTFGSSFYDQMYKELEELSSERVQLVRQGRAQFRSQSLFFPLQAQDRRAGFSMKGRSSSDFKNLANGGTKFEKSQRSGSMQSSGGSQSFWNEPIGSHTPGSKRQRSGTSPAREHGNKLLRLSVGKAESQAGRKKQGQHSTFSASLNQAARTSNKGLDRVGPINFGALNSGIFRRKGRSELVVEKLNGPSSAHLGAHFGLASPSRMRNSSFGRWKPALEEAQTKTTAKRKVLTTRKIRAPAWVERMSKAKNVFSSLLRPLLQAQFRKESQSEAIVRKRNSRPSGLMVIPSLTLKQLGKQIPGVGAFSLVQLNSARKHGKKSVAPIQYDISTGRKIVNSEQEPGELLQKRVENQHVRPNFKSLHEKNIRITTRPIVKHGIKPSAVANSGGDYLRIKGWNADPFIRSDIPHKPADIIRYNRNGGLDVQIRKRDAGGKHKSSSNSVGRMNIRHVTFAGMVVHNSRYESTRRGLLPPQSINSLQTQIASKKASASQPSGVTRASGKRRSSTVTKIPPTQGKIHRYGGGGRKWTYHEGFWAEMFKPELENVSQENAVRNLLTPGCMSQSSTPTLITAQVVKNVTLHNPLDRSRSKDLLTVESSSSLAKRTDDEDVTGTAGEKLSYTDHSHSSATNFGLSNDSGVQRICEGDGKSQNPAIFKSQGFFGSDALEGGAIINHSSVVATKVFSSPLQSNEEDERVQSFSETKSTIMLTRQAPVSMIDCPRHDYTKRLEQKLCSEESSQSPLRLLDDVFPESTENEALVSMFDRLHEATSIDIKAHSEVRHPASECITQQRHSETQDRENDGQLRKLELERTLMDIALHTILQDNPLQVQDISATRTEPISLPIKRRVAMRADKEVEAIVYSHDMSQSPLFNSLPCVDRSTEQDTTPRVDRATEQDAVPYVDRATGLENSSLSFKDQDSQTTDAECRIQNIQMFTSPTQEKCGEKLQSVQVHQQAIESRVPYNTVGIQIPGDNSPTIAVTRPYPPAAIPMLMPVFFQQLGMSMLPVALPSTVNIELPACITTSSNLQPSPVSAGTENFQTGVDQGTQATESHFQPNSKDSAAQAHHEVPKLPISSGAAFGELGVCEEESDSDWEESKRGSSPSTPSTPVSSPGHKISLKRAMQLCPDNSSIQEAVSAKNVPQPLVSEMCQVSAKDDLQVHQVSRNELAPPIEMVTEMIGEEVSAEEPLQITSARDTRRGSSWAKVKEMEEAALTLLRAASMKTPSATSSSECSRETSPEVYTWMSPGEVNIEEVGRSSTGGRFLSNSRTSQVEVCKQTQSHEWSWFGCGRASIGEICNPARFLGLLSEGEIEAGAVPSAGELGQILNEYNHASNAETELQGQGSEPGEYLVNTDASSPPKSPTQQIVS